METIRIRDSEHFYENVKTRTFRNIKHFYRKVGKSRHYESIRLFKIKINSLRYFDKHYNIIKLSIRFSDLKSLAGIEKMTNLQYLILRDNNKLENIDDLSSLSNLKELCIYRTNISSFEILRNMNIGEIFIDYRMDYIEKLNKVLRFNNTIVFIELCPFEYYSKTHKINKYKFIDCYSNYDLKFSNYKIRMRKQKSPLLLVKKKISYLWFLFFEKKRDNSNYNRFSYLCVSEMIK